MSEEATCSAIITFADKLEDRSSKFYKDLSAKAAEEKEIFLAFAKESMKNKVLVTRTYQETITDALEACFIQMNLSSYSAEATLTKDTNYIDGLKTAIKLEEEASRFYHDAAERSQSLLATIPRAFKKVAERRGSRKAKLESLLKSRI